METTQDAFLDGRLTVLQPAKGYRAAMDAVFLAAACPAQSGQTVLDLGLGVGVAALCLSARVPGLYLTGLEIQPDYAALAEMNAARNAAPLEVICGDAAKLGPELKARSFDHVITNPPFFDPANGLRNPDAGRDKAFRESMDLGRWLDIALRRVGPAGSLTVIHRAERLPILLSVLDGRLGGLRIIPLQPRQEQAAGRVIVTGRKGSKAPLILEAPFCIHAGTHHRGDFQDLTPEASAILKTGTSFY